MMRTPIVLLAMSLGPVSASAQAGGPAPACDCQADLDSLAAKLERNYIAFRFEVAGKPRESAYRTLVARLHDRAASTSDADCIHLLRELTDWFGDGHLFVFQWPAVTPEETARLAAQAERRDIDEARVRAELDRRKGRLDPIEGIWYAPGYRIGILREPTKGGPDFTAVVLQSDSAQWRPGQVKGRFWRNRDGSYRTIYAADDHSRRDVTSRVYRNLLLTMSPVTWGRAYPLAPHEVGSLDPVDPTRPTVRLFGAEAVVVSVPSHDPKYRGVLDSLMAHHRAAITSRPYLVVDIRGDIGGGSLTTAAIVPFMVTKETRPPIGPSGASMVLSSPDNIAYFEQGGWNPDSIAQRMSAAPGQLLQLIRNETLGMPFPNDTVLPMPRKVGVLMDRGVASAGEAFALQARKSTKVQLFGENSYGMIDYQSVRVVRLACRARGNLFGYPMIAASATLPKDGLNKEGVPVDVRIGRDVADQVGWVLRALRGPRRRASAAPGRRAGSRPACGRPSRA
ncbi:MAG: hypothetical protein HOP28_04675 [Gemmatimonadales bacterium]|nr:hypothetical protein [Gemmatimonadales bacterium]